MVAPSVVSDRAVKKACYIVQFLFADRHDIRENMYKYFGRVAVIGRYQGVTYSNFDCIRRSPGAVQGWRQEFSDGG